jgi:3'-phosphoadenosine 5'-phosphosulfate sulfotransferase (PAPS reductase)/FAD synthetase
MRKDLSAGWSRLNRLQKWDFERKVGHSHRLLEFVLGKHKQPVVCWSGGKDSTVVLSLVKKHYPDIPVIYVDSRVEFPEGRRFVKHVAKIWKLNLIVAKPSEKDAFWKVGSRFGWPIFRKNIASNVERAVRTGNIREQLSPLEKFLAQNRVHISARCCEYLQEKPSKEVEELLKADLKIVGLRAHESRARVRLWVDHGDYFYVKRYFGRNRGIWKANPISIWTEEDEGNSDEAEEPKKDDTAGQTPDPKKLDYDLVRDMEIIEEIFERAENGQ